MVEKGPSTCAKRFFRFSYIQSQFDFVSVQYILCPLFLPLLAIRLWAQSTFRPDHFWPAPLLPRLFAQTDQTVLHISPNFGRWNCSLGFAQFFFSPTGPNRDPQLRLTPSPRPPAPLHRTDQNFAFFFFFPFPTPFRSFSVFLGVFSLNFGGVFEAPGT